MAEINSTVKKYVIENDVEAVKSTLTGMAYVIDSFEAFKDSAEYAIASLGDIFDDDDGVGFSKEKTISNYKHIAGLMMDNFSKRKYEAVVEIGIEVILNQNEGRLSGKESQEAKNSPFSHALRVFCKIVLKHPIIAAIVIIAVILIIWRCSK